MRLTTTDVPYFVEERRGKYPKPKTETLSNPNTREENGKKREGEGEGKKKEETPAPLSSFAKSVSWRLG